MLSTDLELLKCYDLIEISYGITTGGQHPLLSNENLIIRILMYN